jgi:SAM-dependent methyltransferase
MHLLPRRITPHHHTPRAPTTPNNTTTPFRRILLSPSFSFLRHHPTRAHSTTNSATPTMADRAAADAARAAQTKASYETDDLMAQYLSLHFGTSAAGDALAAFAAEPSGSLLREALGFPAKCGRLVISAALAAGLDPRECRALDLGCAVGGSTMVMAAAFGKGAVGVDLSQTFVDAAERVRSAPRDKPVPYDLREEGDTTLSCEASVEALFSPLVGAPAEESARAAELAELARQRASFAQGDACSLPAAALAPGASAEYDCVLAANLLCRVPSPKDCLNEIHRALKPGGVVIFTSPFTWMQQYTDKSKWLGGGNPASEGRTCGEALRAELESMGFAVRDEGVQPLVIRETKRKYQLILAHRTVAVKLR